MVWRYDRAQELLDEQGRTRRWLADQCSVTDRTVGAYMSGHGKPGSAVVKLAAMALGCSEDYLLGKSDERGKKPRSTG